MSWSHGPASAQNFTVFAQNLEICKLKFDAFYPLLQLFLNDSHILCDFWCDFYNFSCAKYKNISFDRKNKSSFRMSS